MIPEQHAAVKVHGRVNLQSQICNLECGVACQRFGLGMDTGRYPVTGLRVNWELQTDAESP